MNNLVESFVCQNISCQVFRSDLNHPVIQGNKWYKLKYAIQKALDDKVSTLLTFGGAHSNHLLATAFAAKEAGLHVVGVVRGDELADRPDLWSRTLIQSKAHGMALVFVSRSDYRLKERSEPVQIQLQQHPNHMLINEGGTGPLAVKGVVDMMHDMAAQLTNPPTHLFCPVGTGGTLAGVVEGVAQLGWACQVCGVGVLKGLHGVKGDVLQWLTPAAGETEWSVLDQYHHGGYAKSTPALRQFAVDFQQTHGIPLDKIYNAKSFYAMNDWIKQGRISNHDRPMIIHTGGLQGGTFGATDEPSH